MRIEIFKFFRFCLIGSINTALDFITIIFLFEVLKFNLNLAIVIAFFMANTHSFYFNKYWTFKNSNLNLKKQYLKFFLVSLLGVSINLIIINFLVNNFSVWYIYAKIVAISFVLIINFFTNRNWTFKNQKIT